MAVPQFADFKVGSALPGQGRRSTGRAVQGPPRRGQPATFFAPSARTAVTREHHIIMVWEGQKAIDHVNQTLVDGFARLRDAAQRYWRDEEWTEANHPEMTGTERDSATFTVQVGQKNTVEFNFSVSTPYAEFEEFGTINRPGHYPVRKTMDRVAFRAKDFVARANVAGPAPPGFQAPTRTNLPPMKPPKGSTSPARPRRPRVPRAAAQPVVVQHALAAPAVAAPETVPAAGKTKPEVRPAAKEQAPAVEETFGRIREGMEVEVPGFREGTFHRGQVVAIMGSRMVQVSFDNGPPELFDSRQIRRLRRT